MLFFLSEKKKKVWSSALLLPVSVSQDTGKGGDEVVRALEVAESGLKFSFALSVPFSLGTVFSSGDGAHIGTRGQTYE